MYFYHDGSMGMLLSRFNVSGPGGKLFYRVLPPSQDSLPGCWTRTAPFKEISSFQQLIFDEFFVYQVTILLSELVFMLEALKAKIMGAFNRLCCCYANLLCIKDYYHWFSNSLPYNYVTVPFCIIEL